MRFLRVLACALLGCKPRLEGRYEFDGRYDRRACAVYRCDRCDAPTFRYETLPRWGTGS